MLIDVLRRGLAPLLVGAVLMGGCASLRAPREPGAMRSADSGPEVRPDAPPEYDVLVAQQHETYGRLAEATAAYQRALEKDPDSAFLHQKVANSLVRQGRPGDALVHAQRALELAADDPQARVFLGQLYRLRRDFEAAEAALLAPSGEPYSHHAGILLFQVYLESDQTQQAVDIAHWLIDSDPESISAYSALAEALELLGESEEAEATLRLALERDPGNPRIYSQLARAARQRGDTEGERAVYREVLEDHPFHHATMVSLADVQLRENDLEGALATLTEIEASYPDDMRSVVRLGFLHYEAGNFEAARERFERSLTTNPGDSEVGFFLGIVRRRLGDDRGAIDAFSAISEDDDNYAEARTQLAILYERSGDFQRALTEVDRAVAAKPTRPRELYSATLRAKAGDFDGAVEFLEGLLLKQPDDDELLFNLGIVFGEAKRTQEALQYMNRAIEKNPQNASALNYVGYTWAEHGDNLDQAEEYIVRALDLRPDDGFITDSLGWVYYMRARPLFDTGREAEARRYIERSLKELLRAEELTGGDPVVSEHLGDAYLLLDDRQQALEKYEEAVELEPRHGEQPELLDKLEALRREFE